MSGKEGFLYRHVGVLKSWKKQWFFVEENQLKFADKAGKKERGSIDLSKVTQVQAVADHKRPAFKIVAAGKTHTLAAETQQECQSWIEALQPGSAAPKSASSPAHPAAHARHPGMADYTVLKTIGKGGFGVVQLVRSNIDRQLYAMKTMDKRVLQEADQVSQTIVERDVLFKVRHPFTVGAHATFQTPETIVMILDYIPGGELFGRLKEDGKFSESRARLYAAELALAIGHLHSNGFIYRDLKPENILVDTGGHLRVTDFGLVKAKMQDAKATTSTFCGTPEYIAPEMLLQQPYTKGVDWWSFGVLFFEMLAGLPPFYDENTNKMYRKILSSEIPFPSSFSREARDLIEKLLDRDPERRLGANERDVEDIKAHAFFRVLSWEKVYNKEYTPEWVPRIASDQDTKFFNEDDIEDSIPDVSGAVVQPETQAQFHGFTFTEDGPLK
jgi:serine/threonine protein kinase